MRLGFVYCLTNDFDPRAVVQKLAAEEADVTLDFEKAPTLLNVPAAFKRLFNSGVDACLAFVQSSSEERMSLALAQEKAVDVEREFGKYSLICAVLDEEGEGIEALAEERLKECLQLLLGVRPEKVSFESPVDLFSSSQAGALDMFNTPGGQSVTDDLSPSSDGRSLF